MNLTVGASSLAAIAVGALTVFGSSGLLCLEKAGVKTIPEKRIEQILHLGMGSIFLGTVGFVSATVAGASIATLLNTVNRDDEEEPLASSNNNSVVFESSENIPTVESIATQDNTESLYLYQIMQLNSCSHFETKLTVGRLEDEPSRKVFIYDFLDSFQVNSLMELFDCYCDEDQLIGKAFSHLNPKPLNAVREFIDFYRPQLEYKNSEGYSDSSFKLETCAGCRNFHGADKIVFGIHPYGWDDSNCACPDWESNNNQKRVYFPFEREEVLQQLNQSIKANQATLIKIDNGLYFYGINILIVDSGFRGQEFLLKIQIN